MKRPHYQIVKPMELYPLLENVYIISSTPFLYHRTYKTLILGDLHLGHETQLFYQDNNNVSTSCLELTRSILQLEEIFEIKKVICNGDIKHHTNSIKIQELEELKYFVQSLTTREIEIEMIKGNHDKLLEFIFPHIDLDYLEIKPYIELDNILIHHGHLLMNHLKNQYTAVVLSHEHPAYTFRGINRAKVKLPAFVMIQADELPVIIIPAANSVSTGTNYPLNDKSKFLSPYLQKHAELQTLEIFPFDQKLGLLELPPVNQWVRD